MVLSCLATSAGSSTCVLIRESLPFGPNPVARRSVRADSRSKIADFDVCARWRVPHSPGESEVRNRFPTILAARVVATTGELDVRRHRGILLLETVIRLVHSRRHQVVVAGGDEEQWRSPLALEIHSGFRMGLEVGKGAIPDDLARRGDVVPIVHRP